ncbi:MAG: sulfotransferase domain-containing protein [bacterium]|nr:sulfotransferase domain-containing protein [bacterium]
MRLREYMRDCAWKLWEPLSGKRTHFPDFLGIGAQKAGTTWLHENLSRHPEVFLPKAKELHFFDANYHRGMARYRSYFRKHTDKLCGEITPAYGHLPAQRIKVIHDANPGLKLILLLRHPAQRAWSGATMDLAERRGRAASDVPLHEFETFLRSPKSIQRSSYINIIDSWTAQFPEEQLFIGFYEDIIIRPVELFRQVLRHIGANDNIQPECYALDQVVIPRVTPDKESGGISQTLAQPRPQGDIPVPLLRLLEKLYMDEIKQLAHRFGPPCENWLRQMQDGPRP